MTYLTSEGRKKFLESRISFLQEGSCRLTHKAKAGYVKSLYFILLFDQVLTLCYSITVNSYTDNYDDYQHFLGCQCWLGCFKLSQSNSASWNYARRGFFLSCSEFCDADCQHTDYNAQSSKDSVQRSRSDLHLVSCDFWCNFCLGSYTGIHTDPYRVEYITICGKWDFAVFGHSATGLLVGCLIVLRTESIIACLLR